VIESETEQPASSDVDETTPDSGAASAEAKPAAQTPKKHHTATVTYYGADGEARATPSPRPAASKDGAKPTPPLRNSNMSWEEVLRLSRRNEANNE
jgi:hypothetical protein